jgi:DNA-binding response OmpR family regulator
MPSVLVLEPDPLARSHVEGSLRAEGYWVVGTSDPKAAQKLIRVGAADLILADPRESLFAPVPRWARRRTDTEKALPDGFFDEGYAVLRSLDIDPGLADFPMVILKEAGNGNGKDVVDETTPPLRFAVLGYVPRGIGADSVIDCLKAAYRILAKLHPAPAPAPAAKAPAPASPPSGKERVSKAEGALFASLPKALRKALLVDPDADSRKLLRQALEPFDVTVYEAASLGEAVKLALSARPWLILTEVDLPGKDGFEFCAEVRSHRLLKHTPFLFISERDGYEDRAHALEVGADDFLAKPVRVREVLIRAQLTLKRYSDLRSRSRNGPGMEGELEIIGAPSVLQMCHISQFTGIFTSHSNGHRAQVRFREGQIIGAETGGWMDAAAVYAFLGWTKGHFEFVLGDPGDGSPLPESFDQLLLEGCRRLDEASRDANGEPADVPA